MAPKIVELIAKGDVERLNEIMAEDEDWVSQLDAAEGLLKLGDRRGLDFLYSAEQSEEHDVRQAAREILDSPELARQRAELEADDERAFRAKVEDGKKRLQKGQRVFRYKMVYLPSGDILQEDPQQEGYQIAALDELGLAGWEVVHLLPRLRQVLVNGLPDSMTGAYVLLKKEVTPAESAELDEL